MKKIKLFIIISLSIGLNACKDKDPVQNHGRVELNPTEIKLLYGEKDTITPYFSDDGLAKSKKYMWRSENEKIASCEAITGNRAEVVGKRAGSTNVGLYAMDGSISALCKITVSATSNFLPFIYFKAGESKESIERYAEGVLNEKESNNNLLIYDVADLNPIIQQIYYFENERLVSMLLILEYTEENLENAELFIREFYDNLNTSTAEYINYYDAAVDDRYEKGTVIGIFLPTSSLSPENIRGKFGIKYTTFDRI